MAYLILSGHGGSAAGPIEKNDIVLNFAEFFNITSLLVKPIQGKNRQRFLDPLPLLSILYMHLIFNTWIKLVMRSQRPVPIAAVITAALDPLAAALVPESVLT